MPEELANKYKIIINHKFIIVMKRKFVIQISNIKFLLHLNSDKLRFDFALRKYEK